MHQSSDIAEHAAPKRSAFANFRRFFLRGLGILLPTVLTIWILIAAYGFVQERIAIPINNGIKKLVLTTTDLYMPTQFDVEEALQKDGVARPSEDDVIKKRRSMRRAALDAEWERHNPALDLIGLVAAIILIYIVGALVGSFLGRRLYAKGEALLTKVPLFKQVYPYVKQVTDFLLGDETEGKLKFRRVVAVEYPRKGLWSVGLVTGDTMATIQDAAGEMCLTIFVPSSPTPFTGYVITVPKRDTIDLSISIEEALRFTVSGGVVIPDSQVIKPPAPELAEAPRQKSA